LDESIAMARIAVDDGIRTIVTTPHQLGNYSCNRGAEIRRRVAALQAELTQRNIPLTVLPGGDVRIEPRMIDGIKSGDVMTLADRRRHVLLELPHELYFPLEPVLGNLKALGMQGILSHPERNHGIRAQPKLVAALVEVGCLMQVTAGSLVGTFGPASKALSEAMIKAGHVHFLSTDAHRSKSRRPLLRRAFECAAELVGAAAATKMCCENPGLVVAGQPVAAGKLPVGNSGFSRWFKAAA
jgi:protein-tyrosine phosphatase